ncbi:hypothetical protein [Sphingomonas sp.]|uniref:hypothetical protein n=1 Tax=Sphingomonas sp. TaxID=28214 RepID=UPI001B235EBC|nr:hypothetical protein [Sphingomonas sp.]MBO9714976.1 hypothetical protein [Sphingomonas sp.]
MPLLLPMLALQDADPCAVASACRHVDTLRIESADGTAQTIRLDQTLPWVTQGNVLLNPGDSVTIVLDEQGGELVPRLVRAGDASRNTKPAGGEIRFGLGTFRKGSLLLTVESSRTDTLDYAALMVTTTRGPERTSVCSLMPGIAVFENWQAPIYQLALWSFRPTAEPGCKTLQFPKKDGDAPKP